MKDTITWHCSCGNQWTLTVNYTPPSKYTIGDYGPPGAVFEDPSDVDIIDGTTSCVECDEKVDNNTLLEMIEEDYERRRYEDDDEYHYNYSDDL